MVVIGIIVLLAVGPEQLPSVIRKVGQVVSQVRSVTDGFKSDFMAGIEEIEQATDINKLSEKIVDPFNPATFEQQSKMSKRSAASPESSSEQDSSESVDSSSDGARSTSERHTDDAVDNGADSKSTDSKSTGDDGSDTESADHDDVVDESAFLDRRADGVVDDVDQDSHDDLNDVDDGTIDDDFVVKEASENTALSDESLETENRDSAAKSKAKLKREQSAAVVKAMHIVGDTDSVANSDSAGSVPNESVPNDSVPNDGVPGDSEEPGSDGEGQLK